MTTGPRRFSATWEGSATLPTLAFGNYLDLSRGRQDVRPARTTCWCRPQDGGATYADPIPLTPGLVHALDPVQRLGPIRPRRPADDQRPHYYLDGEEQLWRVDEGEAPRLYTHDEGWQPMQIWGMGIASYDVTGDGLPEVFLTSQGDNKLQTLGGRSRPAELSRHRVRRAA